jgi:lantibiotic modifying enzyme
VSYGRAWCHGAPGVALARLRALTLDRSHGEPYASMARVGLATTLEVIDKNLKHPDQDTSLCHGLGGLMDILLSAGRLLEDGSYLERAFSLARALIERHARSGDWPSGLVSRGTNPSLMLGSAGIGYSFLRLVDPATVPSILLLAPGEVSH